MGNKANAPGGGGREEHNATRVPIVEEEVEGPKQRTTAIAFARAHIPAGLAVEAACKALDN